MSTNLEYRAGEREKEKVGGRPAKLNEKKGDRDLVREIKNKGDIFDGRTTWKFCSSGDKIRNDSGHQSKVKMSAGSEKKVNENAFDISSIKRVTKKFLEVQSC